MPYIEILGPPIDTARKAKAAETLTASLTEVLSVTPSTVTCYFVPFGEADYAHAGAMGSGRLQRILVKLHAYRRPAAVRRRAAEVLTRDLAAAFDTPASEIAVYFMERDLDQVAHDGRLSSD